MKDEFIIRKATVNDIPFLVDTIIASEKSGSDILSYSTIFGLTLSETKLYLTKVLEERENGCGELSVSNYLAIDNHEKIVASSCSWIESGCGDSAFMLKSNLLFSILPKHTLNNAKKISRYVSDMNIAYPQDGLCLGSLYVDPLSRGKFLEINLIRQHLSRSKMSTKPLTAYTQCFTNNIPIILIMKKIFKFQEELIVRSKFTDILKYLPFNEKVLLKKELNY